MWSMFCDAVFIVLSSFEINSLRKRELVALLELCSCCGVAVSVLCLFLTVPWNDLWSVIVAFPGHTHLLFEPSNNNCIHLESINSFMPQLHLPKASYNLSTMFGSIFQVS